LTRIIIIININQPKKENKMKKINYLINRWKVITPQWDNEELSEYRSYLGDCTQSKINEMYNRQKYLNSNVCSKSVNNEVSKMFNSGMFDKIKIENALD